MKILLAYNKTRATEVAAERAAMFAVKFNAEVYLLHVIQDLSYSIIELPEEYFTTAKNEIVLEAERMMRSIAYRLSAKGVTTKYLIAVGSVVDTILATAEEIKANLIVVGYEKNSRFAKFLNGNISRSISAGAKCDVLIVKS